MYTPLHFAETRPEELHRIIREHPLGVLVTCAAGGLDANHLPFEFHPDQGSYGTLHAHIARANPLWNEVAAEPPVMVVFRGVEGYISPSWYPSKHETHQQVPTWNYEVVHAHGRLRVMDEEKFVRGVLARLTREHEAKEARPWRMGDSPQDYIDRMISMVVGIEIKILRLEGKRKLSQNRETRDIQGAADELHKRGREDLAALMTASQPGKEAK